MNSATFRNALAVALTTAFLAGCHGGGNSIPSVGVASGPRHDISITITRGSATASSTTRAPQTIPNNAQSVDARIYSGSTATGAPVSTACVSFPAGTTSTTLTIGSPIGVETIVISSWSGACSNNEGSGQLLTTFTGTGTVSASSTTVAQVFNSGNPISLQPPSAPVAGTIPAVQFTNLGPVWQNVLNNATIGGDLAGSGKIQSVVPVGPSTPTSPARIIYIAGGDGNGFEVNVSSGIYKTVDGGQTWYPIGYDNGLTDTRVNDIYVDQSNPNVVLAATYFGGVFRSTDGGSSWTQVDQNAPATHFAQLGSTIYVADAVGVEQSTDDGATWTAAGTGFASAGNAYGTGADSIAAAPPSTLIAGDYNGYTWSFNGTTWTKGGQLAATALGCGTGGNSAPAAVHTIAIDQSTPSTVWATGFSCTMGGQAVSQELYLSTNGGASWTDAATQASSTGVGGNPAGYYGSQMLANSINVAHTVYMGAEFTEWRATPNTTTPPSATYTAVNGQTSTTQGNTYGDMRGLTVVSNGAGGDACYIAADQGLYYQGTCGQTAGLPIVLTGGLSTNFLYGFGVGGTVGSETIMTTIQDFGPAAAAVPGGGLSASDWTGSFGGTSSLGEGGDAEVSPFNAKDCVVSQTSKPALNFSVDGCQSFNPSSPSTLASVSSLSFSRKTAGLLFIADGTGGLYKSTDDGAAATVVTGANALLGASGSGISFIRVDPENDNNLFAIVTNASTGGGTIEYSTNGGSTWTASTTTFTTAPAALAINPQNSSDIVAVGGSGALTIYTSTNGGVSFTSSSPPGLSVARQAMSVLARRSQTFPLRFAPPRPPWRFDGINARLSPPVAPEEWVKAAIQPQYATALEFNPNAPAGQDPILALSTGFGLFASPDLGTSWTRLDNPGSGAISRRFTKVEWLGGYLYASTDGQGLLRSSEPLQ